MWPISFDRTQEAVAELVCAAMALIAPLAGIAIKSLPSGVAEFNVGSSRPFDCVWRRFLRAALLRPSNIGRYWPSAIRSQSRLKARDLATLLLSQIIRQ